VNPFHNFFNEFVVFVSNARQKFFSRLFDIVFSLEI